jgi:glycosyltransferase involved in cell wall biosynthesis
LNEAASWLPDPRPIAEHRWPEGTRPVVSILCTAYNHEKYLDQTIRGFLKQSTRFPVEILLHDDASTDGTARIIERYAREFPALIRPVIQSDNQHAQGRWAVVLLMQMATGEFMALCEGDDYWTAPDKLEAQVSSLYANPQASASFHKADGLFESTNELVPDRFSPYVARDEYGLDDILERGNFVATHSIVFRGRLMSSPPEWLSDVPHCDIALLCIAAQIGPLLYIDRSMGVYRKHEGGLHTGDHTIIQHVKSLRTYYKIGEKLDVLNRPAFKHGVQYSMSEIARILTQYETRLKDMESRHAADRATIDGIMRSRTFRLGMKLSRTRDRLLNLMGRR